MPIVAIKIPQLGEGLQEARLVAVLKQPGEHIKRDEPIYQMETDKAVMDVESPYDGVLVEWLADADAVLPIGSDVCLMEVAAADAGESPSQPTEPTAVAEPGIAAPATRNANVPPRTRAYAKEKGIADEQLALIPSAGAKLMPSDIDAYLSAQSAVGYVERAVSGKQRLLMARLQRGHHLAVPGTMAVVVSWEAIEAARALQAKEGGDFQPSAFTMFAYAVAQAAKEHELMRSQLVGESTVRVYDHLALGIAVALPDDELVLAVVEDADALGWREFASLARQRIELARSGVDQAGEAVTLSLTNLQAYGIRDAVPVVVPPAMATLFLGEIHNGFDAEPGEPELRRQVNVVLTFDHRLSNGAGAAHFLNAVKRNVETVGGLLV